MCCTCAFCHYRTVRSVDCAVLLMTDIDVFAGNQCNLVGRPLFEAMLHLQETESDFAVSSNHAGPGCW